MIKMDQKIVLAFFVFVLLVCLIIVEIGYRKAKKRFDAESEKLTKLHADYLPLPSTDYRDRVDRMAAAILSGQWANHAVRTMQPDEVAEEAAMQIDAIDEMLKDREANT